jgi:hypothetical protein
MHLIGQNTRGKGHQPTNPRVKRNNRYRHAPPLPSGFLRVKTLAGERPARANPKTRNTPHHAVSANNSRPISIRRISLVPAPISYSFASRSSRPVG